jgi:predicted permease
VLRQLLTESTVLAGLGGVAGVLLGIWAVDALVAAAPENAPRLDEIGLDARVLAFAAALTVLTGVLFGLAPALHAARGDVGASLKEAGRGHAGAGGRGLRRALVVAEVALALILLTGAGLLLQTFVRLQSADLGFRPEGVLTGFFSPPQVGYPRAEQLRAFYDQVLEKAEAIPGVETAALASVLPLSGDSDTDFTIEGRPAPSRPGEQPVTWYRLVSASYFDAIGMRLVRGRAFARGEAAPSAIVNEALARRYFPSEDALGRRIRFGGPSEPWFTVIGVVADARVRGAREETRVETVVPYWQFPERGMNVILKAATGNPAALAVPLRAVVQSVDRNVPASNVRTLAEMVGGSIAQPRFFAVLAAAFAVLAVVLAAVGLYGVMAYAVAQRTPEIGVRMALGAAPREVFRLVVGDGLRLAGIGVALGVAGSLVVARSISTLLFGVGPWDPATLAATALGLLLVGALACLVPARRATRVDPMVALRAE